MKKRVFALLLAAVSVLMLFGCTQTPETTAGVKTGQAITISKSTGADGTAMTETGTVVSDLPADAPCFLVLSAENAYVELLSVN